MASLCYPKTKLVETTAPTSEPLTLAEAKTHLRVDADITEDDALISSLIVAARQAAETHTRRQLVNATYTLYLDWLPQEIRLERPPVSSITYIKYIDTDGTQQTLSSAVYQTDLYGEPARIHRAYMQIWPITRQQMNAVEVKFVCGYGSTAASVPDGIKAAMKLMIGNWYENREATISGTIITEVPMAAKFLLDQFSWGSYA